MCFGTKASCIISDQMYSCPILRKSARAQEIIVTRWRSCRLVTFWWAHIRSANIIYKIKAAARNVIQNTLAILLIKVANTGFIMIFRNINPDTSLNKEMFKKKIFL